MNNFKNGIVVIILIMIFLLFNISNLIKKNSVPAFKIQIGNNKILQNIDIKNQSFLIIAFNRNTAFHIGVIAKILKTANKSNTRVLIAIPWEIDNENIPDNVDLLFDDIAYLKKIFKYLKKSPNAAIFYNQDGLLDFNIDIERRSVLRVFNAMESSIHQHKTDQNNRFNELLSILNLENNKYYYYFSKNICSGCLQGEMLRAIEKELTKKGDKLRYIAPAAFNEIDVFNLQEEKSDNIEIVLIQELYKKGYDINIFEKYKISQEYLFKKTDLGYQVYNMTNHDELFKLKHEMDRFLSSK